MPQLKKRYALFGRALRIGAKSHVDAGLRIADFNPGQALHEYQESALRIKTFF